MKQPFKLKIKLNDGIHYSLQRSVSYNMHTNMICGGRGIGKTTTALAYALTRYAKHGEQFVYVRRYKPELKKFVVKNSLSKIVEGVRYKGDGASGYLIMIDDDVVGYGLLLSTSISDKSALYDNVKNFIFDEAFLERGSTYRYLSNEIDAYLGLYSSIQREKTDMKSWLLGNNDDVFNPYFEYFDVPMMGTNDIYVNNKRDLYVEMAEPSKELIEKIKETPLYKLTEGTPYGDYYVGNKTLRQTPRQIMQEKPIGGKLYIRFIVNGNTINVYLFKDKLGLGIWVDYKDKEIYDNVSYVIYENNKPNYYYIQLYRSKLKQYIDKIYYNKRAYASNDKSWDMFSTIVEEL